MRAHGYLVFAMLLMACGGAETAADAGGDAENPRDDSGATGPIDAGPELCEARDCDDGDPCNGIETCAPGTSGADARGCVRGAPLCAPSELCREGQCVEDDCQDGGDSDRDGDPRRGCGGNDCDDQNAAVRSSGTEICDAAGLDEDCNPDTIQSPDRDGDDDRDGAIDLTCFNAIDATRVNRGTDCDDQRATIHPNGVEACDTRDNDCDGEIDEDVLDTYYRDADGDGYGDREMSMLGCTAPEGWVLDGTDCRDRVRAIHPGATEACNEVDDDCSGTVDDPPGGCVCTDGAERVCGPSQAGVGICRSSTQRCSGGRWPTQCVGAVYPEARDLCGGGDQDCDGSEDEDGLVPYYLDMDSDGFGDPSRRVNACSPPSNHVSNALDCNDREAAVNPNAPEVCNGRDDNCNGSADDRAAACECLDGQMRSCGTSSIGVCRLGQQACNSGRWSACVGNVEPVNELCDGRDEDCDGTVDDGVLRTFYRDGDNDRSGNAAMTIQACAAPTGYVPMAGDCDDGLATRAPTNVEASFPCDQLDNDCDNVVDEAGTNTATFYRDVDGDTFGDPAVSRAACSRPIGFVANNTDCIDTGARAADIRPNQTSYQTSGHCGGANANCTQVTGAPGCWRTNEFGARFCMDMEFDFDCDRIAEPQPAAQCRRASPGPFCTGSGPAAPAAESCGRTVAWSDCALNASSGQCYGSPATRVLGCL